MLVLSRHVDESIIIGNQIAITVLDVRGGKVRLGIQAPREISVHRREVYEDIHGPGSTPELGLRAEPGPALDSPKRA